MSIVRVPALTMALACLAWKDGREDMGAGLEFSDIGSFCGDWKNDEEGVRATIDWIGGKDGRVQMLLLERTSPDESQYALYVMLAHTIKKPGSWSSPAIAIRKTKRTNW